MVDAGYHTPLEEYLETIQALDDEGTEVIGARIAERLGRSAPAVKEMLDRMEEDGYVARKGRVVRLTDRGQSLATTVVRRHRLAERLLVDVIGLEWHKVHVEAGRWEHVISAEVEEKLIALLGDPATCPHGNPIPGHSGSRAAERRLSEVLPGEEVELVRITELLEHDNEALAAMDAAGFIPGRRGRVATRGEDGSVAIEGAAGDLVLRADLVANCFVGS
jgi:DtxR family Mn-dependent transcriptional regulator